MRYPYIIAEAGSCHEGQLERALSLIYAARHADADAVKFQYWSSASHMRARRRVADDSAYTRGSIDVAWFPKLADVAHEVGLEFMCTVYLPEDVEEVAKWVDHFKVSSFEVMDLDLMALIGRYAGLTSIDGMWKKHVFMSRGMSAEAWGTPAAEQVITMACTSAYPCPVEEAGLGRISDTVQGYSDHTRQCLTGALAVAAGARYLEVHFRLDDTSKECPDYCVSLTPAELGEYVEGARVAAVMMGGWGVQPSEEVNLKHRVGVGG